MGLHTGHCNQTSLQVQSWIYGSFFATDIRANSQTDNKLRPTQRFSYLIFFFISTDFFQLSLSVLMKKPVFSLKCAQSVLNHFELKNSKICLKSCKLVCIQYISSFYHSTFFIFLIFFCTNYCFICFKCEFVNVNFFFSSKNHVYKNVEAQICQNLRILQLFYQQLSLSLSKAQTEITCSYKKKRVSIN